MKEKATNEFQPAPKRFQEKSKEIAKPFSLLCLVPPEQRKERGKEKGGIFLYCPATPKIAEEEKGTSCLPEP